MIIMSLKEIFIGCLTTGLGDFTFTYSNFKDICGGKLVLKKEGRKQYAKDRLEFLV